MRIFSALYDGSPDRPVVPYCNCAGGDEIRRIICGSKPQSGEAKRAHACAGASARRAQHNDNMANGYRTIAENTENRTEIRRSVFVATIARVETTESAEEFVRGIKKRYSDATHNCYAYIVGSECPSARFSDDGEPSGTAGQPMLEVLRKKGLADVAVVVTRYFGGIKLGAGGLVSAYTDSVARVVGKAGVAEMVPCALFSVSADYQQFARVDSALTRAGGVKRGAEYADKVQALYAVREDGVQNFLRALSEAAGGEIAATAAGSLYLPSDEIL